MPQVIGVRVDSLHSPLRLTLQQSILRRFIIFFNITSINITSANIMAINVAVVVAGRAFATSKQ